ncbi:dNTP triphosphohydrolase [Nitriliruptoraceae bacterium ZYF776]|nr:dNTP triphosphohydrolase [Profundirhabdus halotolerans]
MRGTGTTRRPASPPPRTRRDRGSGPRAAGPDRPPPRATPPGVPSRAGHPCAPPDRPARPSADGPDLRHAVRLLPTSRWEGDAVVDPRDLGYDDRDLARTPGRDDPDDYRHPFARDYDRLVHTSAFRRLQGKTGVVAPGEADFFRTRLTHTVEVAQLARRLGGKLGCHPDLVEAAAIMHDFGHAPFGHVGEEELSDTVDDVARSWGLEPSDVGGYEGNAQTFRLVTKRLTGSSAEPGLHLTRATLDAATKYPWERGEVSDVKWCFYPTEREQAAWLRAPVPTHRRYTQSFEAQVMEWADDVAYAVHDLEDFYLSGDLPLALLTQSAAARDRIGAQLVARRERRGKLADAPSDDPERYTGDELLEAFEQLFTEPHGPFHGFAHLGGEYDGSLEARHALRVVRKQLINRLVHSVRPVDPDAPPRRHHNDLYIPRDARLVDDVLRDLLWLYVIEHPRMATYQHGQRRVVRELFEVHAQAVHRDRLDLSIFPRDLQPDLTRLRRRVDHAAADVEVLRLVADHVGQMTDDHAARLHRRLTGHTERGFTDYVV